MEIGKRIKAHLALKRAKALTSRDMPDPRPPNDVRDRFEAAEVVKKAGSKEEVLGQIINARIGVYADFQYREGFHFAVQSMAIKKATDLGASGEEINKAIKDGNIAGATMRSGMEN